MNKYGQIALEHWQRTKPQELATIPDPEVFFSTLGQTVASQVDELAGELAGADRPPPVAGPMFQPDPAGQLTPSGDRARAAANLQAIRLSQQLTEQNRPATAEEQKVLAAWSSWGDPQIFDDARTDWATERDELRAPLSDAEWAAASRTTLNARYTDPAIGAATWAAVRRLGLEEGQVLEPGCGSGTFIGLAPEGTRMTGVELDPTTARIAQALYPAADIRTESFANSTCALSGRGSRCMRSNSLGRTRRCCAVTSI